VDDDSVVCVLNIVTPKEAGSSDSVAAVEDESGEYIFGSVYVGVGVVVVGSALFNIDIVKERKKERTLKKKDSFEIIDFFG
jgi:hypothetical protein